MAMGRRIGQKDADLAIFNAASGSALLARKAGGVSAFFEKAGLVNDANRVWRSQVVGHVGRQPIPEPISVPVRATEQMLHAVGRLITTDLGNLPAIFALGGAK